MPALLTDNPRNHPPRSLLDLQRIGRLKPTAPVIIDINRFDPLVPWTGANQLGRDWCAQGADVQFWTNEQPPFLNKLDVNHVLTYLVDGERSMQWIADRARSNRAIVLSAVFPTRVVEGNRSHTRQRMIP